MTRDALLRVESLLFGSTMGKAIDSTALAGGRVRSGIVRFDAPNM